MRKGVIFVFILISNFVLAQNKSRTAELLEEKYVIYSVSDDAVDTKPNIKAMRKCLQEIQSSKDTSALDVVLDVYLGYDAINNDIKALSYSVLTSFKNTVLPEVNIRIKLAEAKYGNNRNMYTDYMDLVDLKKKLEK